MTEVVDWEKSAALLDKKDRECETLKTCCNELVDRQIKDTKIIDKQAKQIETLSKTQDPNQMAAYMKVYSRVMGRTGFDELMARVKSLR